MTDQSESLPNFVIIGAPRSGTTWIQRNLKEHPDIFMPEQKELHFFDRDYEKGIEFYKTYFVGARNRQAVGEATPSYLHRETVCSRLHKHLPNARLIVSLRNPVERLYSRYWNAVGKYNKNLNVTFEEKIKSKPGFIEEGFYADHLARFYDRFDANKILVLLYDDLKSAPDRFLRDIYEFLGVAEDFAAPWQHDKINAAQEKPNVAKSKALHYVSKGLKHLGMPRTAIRINRMNATKRPPMDARTRDWLVREVYAEPNKRLSNLIGKDLGNWLE